MKSTEYKYENLLYIFAFSILIYACDKKVVIQDFTGILGKDNTPTLVEVELNNDLIDAAEQGLLEFREIHAENSRPTAPIQIVDNRSETNFGVVLMLPEGESGSRTFRIIEREIPSKNIMHAFIDSTTGQVLIEEGGKRVLQYNYQTVYEKDVIRPESEQGTDLFFSNMTGIYYEEYLKSHPELEKNDTTKSSIYSIPRSDYIHPLYGMAGEILTNDWPDGGHPHHRGIFWAWPEVEYKNQRADIYALQRVFARPTGNIKLTSGPVYAQINAENLWIWEDTEPIVNEHAIIRVYRSSPKTRIIDLSIKLLALKDSVTIATRFTNSYGGLNIRMQTPENQEISYFTDKPNSYPLRAWSDFSGIFEGNESISGLMVLQHRDNPEYPGQWKEYPGLSWVQPTFPSPETRYQMSEKKPLILHYRLIIHADGKPNVDTSKRRWDAYHLTNNPLYTFFKKRNPLTRNALYK